MKKLNEKQLEIVEKYVKLANKLGHHPSRGEFVASGINKDRVRHLFGNFSKLKEIIDSQALLSVPEQKVKALPKVLLFDIETAPLEVYTWGIWDVNVALNQIKQDWTVLSWAAKWLGSDEMMYTDLRASRNKRNDRKLLRDIWRLLDEADIVITQNGRSFDVKKLNARFVINGFQPPSSYRHMDTKIIAKKHFGFTSFKLEYMAEVLDLKFKKSSHKKFIGQDLWTQCLANNQAAWTEMELYNKADVLTLEELYKRISPWDGATSFSSVAGETVCKCGKTNLIKNGFYYTNSATHQRYKCKSCGAEMRDRKNLINFKNIKVGTNR